MAGNVWEWCHDEYTGNLGATAMTDPVGTSGSFRVERGGGWDSKAASVRAASCTYTGPADRLKNLGFRLVKTVP